MTALAASLLFFPFPGLAQPSDDSAASTRYYQDPQKNWPFSPAVQVGNIVYLSGQAGVDAKGHLPAGIEAQTRQAMTNIKDSARLAGVGLDNIFKCTVMLRDMTQWSAFNSVYLEFFKKDRLPARTSFGVTSLVKNALVEIDCMAVAAKTSP
jgi:reactive intermediate/imine deaminase